MQQFEGEWANYSGNGPVTIGPEWQTFTTEFKMEYPTDTNTRFNVTIGSIDGERISTQHDVFIDDISLIEIDEISEDPQGPQNPDDPENPEPGTDPSTDPQDPTNPDDPGTDPSIDPQDPVNPDDPGTEPSIEPENPDNPQDPDQPQEPDEPEPEPEPQEPVIVIPPVIQIIAPVVRTIKRITFVVTSILRRLFW